MKCFAISPRVLLALPAVWLAILWHTTGEGHPFCLLEMSFPTESDLLRDGVRRHLETRKSFANDGFGPSPLLSNSPADVAAFLRSHPDCCTLEPTGSIQGNIDKAVNLIINSEKVQVKVKDPTWREPYITYGRRYTVDTCSLGTEG